MLLSIYGKMLIRNVNALFIKLDTTANFKN